MGKQSSYEAACKTKLSIDIPTSGNNRTACLYLNSSSSENGDLILPRVKM
jgi:hypothetical protein